MSPTLVASDLTTPELSRRHPVPPDQFTFELSERHVRGVIGATAVVDSHNPLLVWEPGRAVPGYVFDRGDVRTDLLRPNTAHIVAKHARVGQRYDLVLDDAVYPGLVFEYDVDGLRGRLAFEWFRPGTEAKGVEHWYEEDEEIFVHPRDPYKRIDPLASSRHVEVYLDGIKLADTRRPVLLFETRLPIRYYIPPEDVDFSHLIATDLATACPYKGNANYWSVTTDRGIYHNLVWSYQEPIRASANIAGRLAFYNELVDLVVDGVALERPESEFTGLLGKVFQPHS
ncbi:MAG: DUF427 domain-containing protein [Bifidobacteriaceae bacterium]|jgi:uncharacterized protein (DUF427 family)|nr:DUF427 domain-containing protein [Bifidobacteriaceae bacterium]